MECVARNSGKDALITRPEQAQYSVNYQMNVANIRSKGTKFIA